MNGVNIKRLVSLNLTREEWRLRNDTPQTVVDEINERVGDAISEASARSQAEDEAINVLRGFSSFGAYDPESMRTLRHILDEVF